LDCVVQSSSDTEIECRLEIDIAGVPTTAPVYVYDGDREAATCEQVPNCDIELLDVSTLPELTGVTSAFDSGFYIVTINVSGMTAQETSDVSVSIGGSE
jgi:hypothetical protein